MVNAHTSQTLDEAVYQTLLLCKQKGLRMTLLRKEILSLVIQSTKPLSAYNIVSVCREKGLILTATTIYRTLSFLEKEGLVHYLATQNAYISCIRPGHSGCSQFCICQNCATVLELHSELLRETVLKCTEEIQFSPQKQVIEVWGLCYNCRK